MTSLDLYEFNQVNNNEMGILISREEDAELFQHATDEAQRIIRISDEVRMSFEKVKRMSEENAPNGVEETEGAGKLSTSRLAKKLGLKTQELTDHLVHLGAIEISEGQKQITPLGRRLGGELRVSARFGPYFLWPEALPLKWRLIRQPVTLESSADSGTAFSAAWKPILEWVPSQNGFSVDAPQRHSAIRFSTG